MERGDFIEGKKIKLINYMMENKTKVLTSKQLADALNISVRSVKSYIFDINKDAKNKVIVSTKNGYILNFNTAKKIILENKNTIPEKYEERANYLIKKFFLKHKNKLDLYDVCDELFVSESTIKSDINKMNTRFKSFNIKFKIEKDNIEITGDEKSIRKLFSCILYEEIENDYMNLELIKTNFKKIDLEGIQNILKEVFLKNDYYINDLAFRNLLLHLMITIDRIIEGKTIPHIFKNISEDEKENVCVKEICEKLEKRFLFSINEQEKHDIYILLKSSTNLVIKNGIKELEELVGSEIIDEIETILYLVYQTYEIDLNVENFLIPFALHLKNLLLRAENNAYIKNPMLELIKSKHLILFDIALYISLQIEKTHSISIPQDEVAFIALHIGSEIERRRSNNYKISAVLICPSYMSIESRLYNEILMNFSSDINIISSSRNLSEIEDFEFELVISTVQVKPRKKYEVCVISPFLNSSDKFELRDKIDKAQNNKKNKKLKKYFNDFFEKDLFFIENSKIDKMEAIDILTENLRKKEYVRDDYKENILERERKASTAFGRMAIPHCVKMNAYKTCISVMISSKGIEWDEQLVNVVLMISINKQDNNIFRELYESLIIIFSQENSIEIFKDLKSYEEFEYTLKTIIS